MNSYPDETIQLLQKAAQCYVKEGWLTEACRVWEKIGEYQQAAPTYEEIGNWSKAASCYEKTKNWLKAAQCYLKCEQAEAAANCYLQAGESLQAAWIWADKLEQSYRSQAEISNFVSQTETEALEIELIKARWEASSQKKRESSKRVREQLEPLLKLLTPSKRHLYEWALKISQEITRPDLTALIYATAYRARIPNACKEWEIWAIATLGDATGIPKEKAAGELVSYEFEIVTVNPKGEIIKKEWQQARYFCEVLGNGIEIEMVLIPGGTFIMGSPKEEKGSDAYSEKPQHQVTVKEFYIGKYQVTQAQWQAVANLPKIERELDPDPSYFKGENRPVERVSRLDAVEFCARLSKATGKEYRLPSEAEWEYACRGGTTTPFHYGEAITSKLANYSAGYIYAEEPAGRSRTETTPVGSFPPNRFGLYDMHGNVWEWCADDWHHNYNEAPNDSIIWLSSDKRGGVRRGGSWFKDCEYSRCASRGFSNPDYGYCVIGFRVVGVGVAVRT